MELLAVPEKIVFEQNGWMNVGSFGLSLTIFLGACFMAKKNILLWGERFSAVMDRVFTFKKGTPGEYAFDWKSLLSFLLGFWGITALFGSTGPVADFVVENLTNLFSFWGRTEIGASIGMGTVCFFVFLYTVAKALKEKDDNISDIKMGGLCAAVFPFGGAPFSTFSALMANSLTEALGGIPVSG